MKKNILIWGTLLILVIVVIYSVKSYNNRVTENSTQNQAAPTESVQAEIENSNKKAGKKAEDFTLTDLDGRKVSLIDYKGKKIYGIKKWGW